MIGQVDPSARPQAKYVRSKTNPPPAPMLDDSPRHALLVGSTVAFMFFVVFLGWAAIARLDAAAFGEGQVIVAGNHQVVQHRYGGNIERIMVHDGQKVRAGQVLLRLSGSEVAATERALAATVIELQAQRARLQAELSDRPIRWPATFAMLTGEDRIVAEEAKRLQLGQQASRRDLLASGRDVLIKQQDQLSAQIGGFRAQVAATAAQRSSLQAQVESTRRLADRGDVSRNTVRGLERSIAELDGNNADFAARAAATSEQIGGARRQITQTRHQLLNESAALLRDTQFQLGEVTPKWAAAREQLERTVIRAPVGGRVVDLKFFSPGAVVQPGQPILDIVPDKAPLEIRAQFAPEDIDGVVVGRVSEVKFLSLHDRNLPILLGTVRNVSADSISDERTGLRRFTAEITVPDRQVALLHHARGRDTGIHPGVPVQVTVKLQPRTALQYLLSPLTDSMSRAFRER